MEKTIWVIGHDRGEMIDAQRRINSTGSMRASCILSYEALQKMLKVVTEDEQMWTGEVDGSRLHKRGKGAPSLIILDYELSLEESYASLSLLKQHQALAGVPLFFMARNRSDEIDEICYSKGATVVLHKPFTHSGILRIERAAWQYEVTKQYEKTLQKQAVDLQAAREIVRLNQQLESRNELLYQIFGRYFSDSVLEVILDNPEQTSIGGERRIVTTMMADIRGFSSMSEELPPEAVMDVLNYFFDQMVDAITMYHGTVIEFLGDAVLAVFGAPVADDSHTADAITAALTMQNRMQQVNAYCIQKDYPLLEMGIAVHCGEVFIGNVGSEKMMRYNVVGRAVNACSRIESYSVGGQVLVSQETVAAAGCPVDVKHTMVVTPKGMLQPVTICEVIGIGGDVPCCLDCSEDCVTPLVEPVLCHVCLVEGKRVKEQPFEAMLTACSTKHARLELTNKADVSEPAVYSDVELASLLEDGTKRFCGVYAKVVAREGRCLTLRFTHVNRELTAFVANLNVR